MAGSRGRTRRRRARAGRCNRVGSTGRRAGALCESVQTQTSTGTSVTPYAGHEVTSGKASNPRILLRNYLIEQLRALVAADLGTRRADDEAVHDFRVAARRIRSALQSYAGHSPPRPTISSRICGGSVESSVTPATSRSSGSVLWNASAKSTRCPSEKLCELESTSSSLHVVKPPRKQPSRRSIPSDTPRCSIASTSTSRPRIRHRHPPRRKEGIGTRVGPYPAAPGTQGR